MGETLVIGNPLVVFDGTIDAIDDGALVVDGDTIVRIGTRAEIEASGPFERVVGSAEHIVLPGFVNGHFHSSAMLGNGMFEYIFERANVRSVRQPIPEDDLRVVVLMNLLRAIRGGQTSAVDFSYGLPSLPDFGNTAILEAYRQSKMRVSLGIVTRDQNIYVHGDNQTFLSSMPVDLADRIRASTMGYAWPTEDVMAAFKRIVGEWEGYESRIHIILAPDWTPACSDELYVLNRRVADEYATAITTHVLETRSEMIFNLKAYGKSAMRRLLDLGVLGPDVSLAHFVWASDEDIAILSDTGAVAVNNPGSNLRLSTGIARTRDIMERGGNVAFGTDGISFSAEEDYLQELRLAALLQRTPGELTRGRMDSAALLRAMAANGAKALHQPKLGSLGVGQKADLITLSRERLCWPPERFATAAVLDVVLDIANASHIDDVMIAGSLVLDGGRFSDIDEAAVHAAYEEIGQRLWAPSPEKAHARKLVEEIEPYMFSFYEGWASVELEPAYTYNVASTPSLSSLP